MNSVLLNTSPLHTSTTTSASGKGTHDLVYERMPSPHLDGEGNACNPPIGDRPIKVYLRRFWILGCFSFLAWFQACVSSVSVFTAFLLIPMYSFIHLITSHPHILYSCSLLNSFMCALALLFIPSTCLSGSLLRLNSHSYESLHSSLTRLYLVLFHLYACSFITKSTLICIHFHLCLLHVLIWSYFSCMHTLSFLNILSYV